MSPRVETLIVDVDVVKGFGPSPPALEALRQVLAEQTLKHEILIQDGEEWPPVREPINQSVALEFHNRTFDRGLGLSWNATTVWLHVSYLNGLYPEGGGGGVSMGDGKVFVFPEGFQWPGQKPPVAALPQPFYEEYDRMVLVHELGHELGLVNCGVPMLTPREDPESRCHSTNPDSVMSTHGTPLANADLETGEVSVRPDINWRFDQYDLADLASFRASLAAG